MSKVQIEPLPAALRSYLRTGVAITSVTQCVEELVLNSLDANSTCIAVRVDLGCFKVQVVDNGEGIPHDELDKLGNRFCTSKCHTIADINNLCHYGYRGEAIASIIDCCGTLEIATRSKLDGKTYSKTFNNGKAAMICQAANIRPSVGTTMTVNQLFINYPVRQKSMNLNLELGRLRETLEGIALIKPGISFSLRNDATGQVILSTKKCPNISRTFSQLYGATKADALVEINGSSKIFKVHGYIGKDGHQRKNLQFVYVNGRLVKKSKIHKLLKKILMNLPSLKPKLRPLSKSPNPSAVKPLFSTPPKFSEAFPVYVLEVKCPISEYDITFDPAKTMVEFKDWDTLLNCVSEVTENFVKSENVVLQLSQSPVKTTVKVDENQTNDAQIIATDNLKDVLVSKAAKRAAKENKVVNSKSSPSESEKGTASDSKALEATDVFKTPRNKNPIICPTAIGLGKRGIAKETPAGHETSTSDESISSVSSMSSVDDTTVNNSEVKTSESGSSSALNNDTTDSLDRTKQGLKRVESSNPGVVCSLSSYKKRLGKSTHDPQDISVDESLQKLQKIFPSSDILHPNRIVSSLQKFRSKFARKENSYVGIGHASSTAHTLSSNQHLGPVVAASNANDKIERNSANDIEAFIDDFNYQNGGLSQYSIQATIHEGDDRESHTPDLTDSASCVSDIQNQKHGHTCKESQNSNFTDKVNRFDDIHNNRLGPMNEYRWQHKEAEKAFRSEKHVPILHEAHKERNQADLLNVPDKTHEMLIKVSDFGQFRNENYGQKDESRKQHSELERAFSYQMSTTPKEQSATNMRDIHDPTMTNIIDFDDFSKNKCGPIDINRQQNCQSEKFSPNHANVMLTEQSVYSPNHVNRACFKDGNQSNRNPQNEKNMFNDKKYQFLSTHSGLRTYPDVYNQARMAEGIGANNCSNTGDDEILYATKLYPEQVHTLGKRSGDDDYSPEIIGKKQCIDLTSPVINNVGKHVPITASDHEANHHTTECPDIDNGQKVESAESNSDFVITECNMDYQEDLLFKPNSQLPEFCDNINCDKLNEIEGQVIDISVEKNCDMNYEEGERVDLAVGSELKIKCKVPVTDNDITVVSNYERKSKESVIENDIVFECTETRDVVTEDETEIADCNDANNELNVTQSFTPHLDQEVGEDEKADDSPLVPDVEKKNITPESLGFSPKSHHLETSDSPRSTGFEIARDADKFNEKTINENDVSCMGVNTVKATNASNIQVENVTDTRETAADFMQTNGENNDTEDIDKVIDNLYNLLETVPENSASKEIQSPKPKSGDTPIETVQSEVSQAAADDSAPRNSLFPKSTSVESLNPKCDSVSITQLLKSPTQSGSHLDAGQVHRNETCSYSPFSEKPGFSGTDLFDETPTCSNPILIETPSLNFAFPNDVNKDNVDLPDTSDTNDAIKVIGSIDSPEPDSATVGANEMCKTADEDVEMNYEDAVKFVDDSCDKCEEVNESSEVLWSDCSWDPSQVMAGQVGKESDTTNAMSGVIERDLSLLKDTGNSVSCDVQDTQRGMSGIIESGLAVLPKSENGLTAFQETVSGGSVLHDTGSDPVVLRKSSGLQQSENGLNDLHQTGNGPSGLQQTQSGCSLLPETGSGHYVLPDTYDESVGADNNEDVGAVDNDADDDEKGIDTGCKKCGHETDEKDSKTDAVVSGQSDLEAWFKNLDVITDKPCTSNVLQTDKPSDVVKKMHACRFSKKSLKSVKVLGQVDKKFIACLIDTESDFELETDDKSIMILVDQHAAHERIRLEILTEDAFEDGSRCGKLTAYKVDQPRYLNFTEQEVRTITNFKDNYLKLGIDFEKKSSTCLLIKTIPESLVYKEKSRIYWNTIQVLMREYLSVFMSTTATSGVLPQTIHKVLCSLACHGAIKFGDKLSDEECVKLINDLSLCDLPFQCAHGRPSVMPLLNMERLKPLSYKKSQRKPNLQKLKRKMIT